MVSLEVVEKFFKLKERKSSWLTEFRAGCVTFLTMAYILAVNAAILSDSDGTCNANKSNYTTCKRELTIDLIYATAISGGISTLLMGITANLPLALAPGMGINAYFTYDVVGFGGSGDVTYENALFATFIEGFIFLILSITGLRFKLMNLIPKHIKLAMTAGIGLFLAHIGLQSSEGLGLVTSNGATLVTLGGCNVNKQFCDSDFNNCYYCPTDNRMEGPTVWLGIFGFCILTILIIYKIRAAMFISIVFITFLSWFRNTSISYFPDNELGNDRYDYFKKVVDFHQFKHTAGALFNNINISSGNMWIALITFLYVDMLDTAGTLFSMAEYMKILDENGNFEGQTAAFCSDAVGTIIGSLLGTSSVTTYIESGSGIEEGGKTGITAIFVSIFFFLSLIFAPILASIPPWATGSALIIIGAFMMKTVSKIDWNNNRVSITSFITIIIMPLTYSIANGIIAGISLHIIIVVFDWIVKKIKDLRNGNDENNAKDKNETEGEIELQKNDENNSPQITRVETPTTIKFVETPTAIKFNETENN